MQQRYVLVFMIFFAIVSAFLQRNVLNMAITRMVYMPNSNVDDVPSNEAICSAPSWIAQHNNTDNNNSTITAVILEIGNWIREVIYIICFFHQQQQHEQDQNLYDWTQNEQGIILSSFFVGYVITHIPGGLLAQKFGGKYVLGLGVTISAVLSILIPLAVQIGKVLWIETV